MVDIKFSGGGASKQTLNIGSFRGVDYANAPYNVSINRSPDAINMEPMLNGAVGCRHGYEALLNADGRINGIYSLTLITKRFLLIHHGNKLSLWHKGADENALLENLTTDMNDKKSTCVQIDNKLYIFDGNIGWVFGEFDEKDNAGDETGNMVYELRKMSDEAYVPLVVIGSVPGDNPGGTAYENINLLTPKRRNRFIIPDDGIKNHNTTTTLILSSTPILEDVKFRYLSNATFDWEEYNPQYTVNTFTGEIKITSEIPSTTVTGRDNFEVEYSCTSEAGTSGNEFWMYTTRYTTSEGNKMFDNPNTEIVKGVNITGNNNVYQTRLKYKNVDDIVGVYINYYGVQYKGGTDYERDGYIEVKTNDGKWYKTLVGSYSKTLSDGSSVTHRTYIYARVFQDGDDVLFQVSKGIQDGKDYDSANSIKITYGEVNENSYSDRVNKATICTKFGYGGNLDRLFVAGYDGMREYEFWSEINNPTYFPDLNYARLGDGDTKIMGWNRVSNNQLAIHKNSNGSDSTVYIQNAVLNSNNSVDFPVTEGASGVGVASERCFGVLNGEPLALSADGVFATKLVTDIPTDIKYAAPRSYYINPKLKQFNLENAEAIVFDERYYLAVDGYVFVADGKQKYMIGGNQGYDYSYEWYLWNNLPVRVWFVYEKELYFGTDDGRICKFNGGYTDCGKPINCHWTTPTLSFGTTPYYKKIKNVIVSCVLPTTEFSEVNIDYIDMKGEKNVKTALIDNTSRKLGMVQSIATNYKVKKCTAMQVRVRADNAEDFVLQDISVLYTVSGKFKG